MEEGAFSPELLAPSALCAHVLKHSRPSTAVQISGVEGGGRGWWLANLARRVKGVLWVVAPNLREAERLAQAIAWFAPDLNPCVFPPWDSAPYDSFSPSKEVMGERLRVLAALRAGTLRVGVCTPQAWMQSSIPHSVLDACCFDLAVGQSMAREALRERLIEGGYTQVDLVEAAGEFSVRGDVMDVFSPQNAQPLRMSLFDDEVESLTLFDPNTQTSLTTCQRQHIIPASECPLTPQSVQTALAQLPRYKSSLSPEIYAHIVDALETNSVPVGYEQWMSVFYPQLNWVHDLFLPLQTLVVLSDPQPVYEAAGAFMAEVRTEVSAALEQGHMAPNPDQQFLPYSQWHQQLSRFPQVDLCLSALGETALAQVSEEGVPLPTKAFRISASTQLLDNSNLNAHAQAHHALETNQHGTTPTVDPINNPLQQLLALTNAWRINGATVVLALQNATSRERLRQLLEAKELPFTLLDTAQANQQNEWQALEKGLEEGPEEKRPLLDNQPPFLLLDSAPPQGFRLLNSHGAVHAALLTEHDVFGTRPRPRHPRSRKSGNFIASLAELKEGDLVVHVEYGVGCYNGLKTISRGNETSDFLVIGYANDEKVYVPVRRCDQIQKHVGIYEGSPKLNRLGDGSWKKTKARATKVVEDIAQELIAVQAARRANTRPNCVPPAEMMADFERAFPFEETEDQRQAIEDILADFANDHPADRLVCGDVGFGKTEVALRASYAMVLAGQQVMLLAPTTILVQQHLEVFRSRMQPFGVQVEALSRLTHATEAKRILLDYAQGKVDVLIGTHKLFSKDVVSKQLGLLVIDEEQRFGVKHKEHIKQRKTSVDVLAMSATPIPRTLQMALMGVRDFSIINTPPLDRISIRTRIGRDSDPLVREAVERELRRGGQVFVVYNRVESIHQQYERLTRLLPGVKVGVAHGQMQERELENVMLDFMENQIEVLLCTTIIESGLDAPNANTMIVLNADRMGLAQLHQLRGRVGRSHLQAYAHLLVRPGKTLSTDAQKRLRLLQQFNDLGAGFRIASHDLEIRGAGNILGKAQSGKVHAIGLELFIQMVEDASARLKGEAPLQATHEDVRVDVGFPYLLPEAYIPSPRQRLDVYKKLAEAVQDDALWHLRENMEDRFGRPPAAAEQLFGLVQVRNIALRLGLSAVERKQGALRVHFSRPEWVNADRVAQAIANQKAPFTLTPEGTMVLENAQMETPQQILQSLRVLEPYLNIPSKASQAA